MGKDQKVPEVPVLHIFWNQDAFLYKAKVREDKVYLWNEKVAEFCNRGVFTVQDMTQKKKKFKMLIYLDGKDCTSFPVQGHELQQRLIASNTAEAELIGKNVADVLNIGLLQDLPPSFETLFEPITFKDRITVVKREIAKQLGKFKPMETWQFIVLIALGAAAIAVSVIFR